MTRAHLSGAETGERAVDERIRKVACADAQPFRDARPEAFEDDVRFCAERATQPRISLEIPDDRLLAGVESIVPARRDRTQGIPVRRFHAYHARTGIPVLINTSFNMHEEPIVCSPADAVRAFLLGNVDYLAAGPFLVPHPKLADNLRSRTAERPGKTASPAPVAAS